MKLAYFAYCFCISIIQIILLAKSTPPYQLSQSVDNLYDFYILHGWIKVVQHLYNYHDCVKLVVIEL